MFELTMGEKTVPRKRFDVIRANIVDRLHEIPVLNKRIVRAPFDLTWPILVVDKKMDIDRHVVRVALPTPGTPDQFDALVSDFLSRPLHPKRPLWQILVIEGLEDGRSAIAIKVHHALADGVSGAETFASLFDISPEVRPPAPKQELADEKSPGSFGLLAKNLGKLRHNPKLAYHITLSWFTRAWHILRSTVKALFARGRKKPLTESPSLFEAKKTSLNGASAIEKEYRRLQLSLPEVKRSAKVRGASVTDFVTAVTSGALRRLLSERGETIKKDLIAFVPINVRGTGDAADLGNQISGMLVRMHANVTDPEERLRLISTDSKKNVAKQREENAKLLQETPRVLGPLTLSLGGKIISRFGLFNRIPPIANLMLSSVPGPPLPLWLSGHRVASAAPVGPLLGPVSLNITVLGFEGYLEFGLLGCSERMKDLAKLRDFICEEAENYLASTPTE